MVLCSSASRSRETLALIAPALSRETKIHVEDELYAATVEALLQRLRKIPDLTTSVMLIGHSPGLQDLALTLAGHGAKLERLRDGFRPRRSSHCASPRTVGASSLPETPSSSATSYPESSEQNLQCREVSRTGKARRLNHVDPRLRG